MPMHLQLAERMASTVDSSYRRARLKGTVSIVSNTNSDRKSNLSSKEHVIL